MTSLPTRARRRTFRLTDPLSSRSLSLWAGVLVPPLAWITHLVLGDLIFELGCAPGVRGQDLFGVPLEAWALIQTSVLAAVTIATGVLVWGVWRRLRGERDGTPLERARALAMAGIASTLIYLAIILYGFLPAFFLQTCRSPL